MNFLNVSRLFLVLFYDGSYDGNYDSNVQTLSSKSQG